MFEEGEVSSEKKIDEEPEKSKFAEIEGNYRKRKKSIKLNRKTLKQMEKRKVTSFARFLVVKKVFAVTARLMHASISISKLCTNASLSLTILIPAETTNVLCTCWHVRGMDQAGNVNQEKHTKRK